MLIISKIKRLSNKILQGSNKDDKILHQTPWDRCYGALAEGGIGNNSLKDYITTFSQKLW